MNPKLNLFAAAIVMAGGLTLARPAQATMKVPDIVLRACCSSADQKQFCCFEGGDGCRITASGCTRV